MSDRKSDASKDGEHEENITETDWINLDTNCVLKRAVGMVNSSDFNQSEELKEEEMWENREGKITHNHSQKSKFQIKFNKRLNTGATILLIRIKSLYIICEFPQKNERKKEDEHNSIEMYLNCSFHFFWISETENYEYFHRLKFWDCLPFW